MKYQGVLEPTKNLQSHTATIQTKQLTQPTPEEMEAALGMASGLIGSVVKQLSDEFVEAYVASTQLGIKSDEIKRDLMFTQGLLHEAQRRGVSDNPGLQGLVQQLSAKADEAEDALDELHYFIIQDQLDGTQYAVPDLGDGPRGHCCHIRHALRHTVGNCIACFSSSRTQDDHRAAAVTISNPHNTTKPEPDDSVDKLSFDRVAMSKKIKSVIEDMHTQCKPVSELLNLIAPHSSTASTATLRRQPYIGSTTTQETLYGRDDIFEKTVHDITSGKYHHHGTLSVLPIVGPGGIGKTTFTQHLYNDKRIQEHFTVRVWVCVSTDFDVPRLTKQIHDRILSVLKEQSSIAYQPTDLDELQISIAQKLKSKKFLIVFDDIWECSSGGWNNLLAPFMKGEAKGSMILVTTRFPSKAEIVKTTNPIALKGLEENDFFTFFEAFIFDGNKPENFQDDLDNVARDIAKKLKGSPLAAKTVGRLLKKEFSLEHWKGVLENNEWQKQKNDDDIMPSLRISYDHLPFHLKKCFTYFALFPDDYRFYNLEITYFWIALGIIEKDENYMEELVENGFLVKETDYLLKHYYVLHDLLHELSQSVSPHECLNISSSLRFRADAVPRSIRHLSITMEDRHEENFREEISKLRSKIDIVNLRALMIFREYEETIDEILKDAFNEIEGLRVLFIVAKSPESLPHDFPKLIHLRYLKLITTRFEMTLPSTLSRFYHLKLLDLRNWRGRDKLPKDISRLINLCHFFADDEFHSNVPEVGKMKCLVELKKFCVKKESVGFELSELGKLTELGGELGIYGLEKVATKEEALKAKLVSKKNMKRLRLVWDTIYQDTTQESDVIDGLEPHPNLQALNIISHRGTAGPSWLCGVDISMKMLQSVCLLGVSLGTVPPFGQLLHLTSLTLGNIHGVRQIGPFFGDKSFAQLKMIDLHDLPDLVEWVGAPPNAHSFSRLERIFCCNCPSLCALPFLVECSGSYTHLRKLIIRACPKLSMPPMPHVSTLTSLSIKDSSGTKLSIDDQKVLVVHGYEGVLAFHNLDKIEDVYIAGASHISLTDLRLLKSLKHVSFTRCAMITYHGGLQDCTWLQSLKVNRCGNFFRCPIVKPFPASLRELSIIQDSNIQSLAMLSNLMSLTDLSLIDCENLTAEGFDPLITAVNLKNFRVLNYSVDRNGPRSIAADLLSGVARSEAFLPPGSFQLQSIEVDSIAAVLVAPICSLLSSTLHELQFSYDQRVEGLTEEEEKALQLLTSLRVLSLYKCRALPSLPQGLHTLKFYLLKVYDCHAIRSLPKGGLPTSLRMLRLGGCSDELNEQAQILQGTNPDLTVTGPDIT